MTYEEMIKDLESIKGCIQCSPADSGICDVLIELIKRLDLDRRINQRKGG